jgi:uncharacterized protein YcbX
MHLAEISIYPVKSLKGIRLTEAVVEARGLQFDRRWMITDKDGKFFTQRELPKMATIMTGITDQGLVLAADGLGEINAGFGPLERVEQVVEVWDDKPRALKYENNVNEWLSQVLETDCQLVYMPDDTRRAAEITLKDNNDIVSFADAYPFLLISENSLNDLNGRLPEPLPMDRFRPNFVVSGAEAFDEHNWKKFSVGENIFYGVKACKRCVMTTIDQQSGELTGKEPLKTLATYRAVKGGVIFGENLLIENPGGVIRIGDEVKVIETK